MWVANMNFGSLFKTLFLDLFKISRTENRETGYNYNYKISCQLCAFFLLLLLSSSSSDCSFSLMLCRAFALNNPHQKALTLPNRKGPPNLASRAISTYTDRSSALGKFLKIF